MARTPALVLSSGRTGSSTLELGKLRQRKGVSLEQIAETTKISMRFLRAIEDEEFDKLPGGIFATSYLRQYAEAVGLEHAKLIARYHAVFDTSDQQEVITAPPSRGGILRWLRA